MTSGHSTRATSCMSRRWTGAAAPAAVVGRSGPTRARSSATTRAPRRARGRHRGSPSAAHAGGAPVVDRAFDSFAAQRDAAVALAEGDWVLFVDADERVPPALRDEVRARLVAPGGCVGFWIPRRNVLMGRVVRYAGWSPDYQLRLLA